MAPQSKHPCRHRLPASTAPPKPTSSQSTPSTSDTPTLAPFPRHNGSVPTPAGFLTCLHSANSARPANPSRKTRRGIKRGYRDLSHLVTQVPAPPYRTRNYPLTIDVIDLLSSGDEGTRSSKRQRKQPPAAAPPQIEGDKANTSDDIVIVSHVVRAAKRNGGACAETGDGREEGGGAKDGVKVVGMTRGVKVLEDYPHFRFQCGVEPFDTTNLARVQRFCARCFCYVCDVPAANCKSWDVHKWAVDSKVVWKDMRTRVIESAKRSDT